MVLPHELWVQNPTHVCGSKKNMLSNLESDRVRSCQPGLVQRLPWAAHHERGAAVEMCFVEKTSPRQHGLGVEVTGFGGGGTGIYRRISILDRQRWRGKTCIEEHRMDPIEGRHTWCSLGRTSRFRQTLGSWTNCCLVCYCMSVCLVWYQKWAVELLDVVLGVLKHIYMGVILVGRWPKPKA